MGKIIIGIESSCDDTSAAVIKDACLLSNTTAGQDVHKKYGGVVPELASRAHQQNIIPVVHTAIKDAGISISDINAVAYTRGPGLMGALLVGSSFAKGLSLSLDIPLIDINHLHAHILSIFLASKGEEKAFPSFPFLCLLVSGGHTQIILMKSHLEMEIVGQTIDDAAGEAFDKCAKIMGLPYPGGPLIDKYAKTGDSGAFKFNRARMEGLDYSFSGLKTSFLYFLKDRIKEDKSFIDNNLEDLCASLQTAIINTLTDKLIYASKKYRIGEITLAGGVSANSGLRNSVMELGKENNWNVYLPEIRFTTDNAAMIALTGFYKYMAGQFSSHSIVPVARFDHL